MDWIARRKWWLFGLIGLAGLLLAWERWRLWRENRHDPLILAAASQYGVEPALVKAVIWRESRFNPRARGPRGELGLMQIRFAAATDWAKAEGRSAPAQADLLDPALNTQAGTWYLAKLLRRYTQTDNPLTYALADYNAGRSNVLRWMQGQATTNSAAFLRQIDFPGTRAYVRSVLKRYQHYRPTFPHKPGAAPATAAAELAPPQATALPALP
jgi:soluble lytic murein transglycosylase